MKRLLLASSVPLLRSVKLGIDFWASTLGTVKTMVQSLGIYAQRRVKMETSTLLNRVDLAKHFSGGVFVTPSALARITCYNTKGDSCLTAGVRHNIRVRFRVPMFLQLLMTRFLFRGCVRRPFRLVLRMEASTRNVAYAT